MKLGAKGRYAVTALVDLVQHGEEGPVALMDISKRQDISLSYLEQLFARLRRSGLVYSVRGPGGGYCLSRPAESLQVADIIAAVEEPIIAARCGSDGHGCQPDSSRCLSHDLWQTLDSQIHLFLCAVSLKDVVERRVAGAARDLATRLATEGLPQTHAAHQ